MASRFWVGGTGTWDNAATTNWSTTTGGASGASAPTSADDVFIDGSSGVGIVTTAATAVCKSLDTTSYGGTLTGGAIINGNLTIGLGTTIAIGTVVWTLQGTGAQTITTNGKTFLNSVTVAAGVGSYTQQDGLLLSGSLTFTLTTGSWITNNFALNIPAFTSNNANVRTLTLGSSIVTVTGGGTVWSTGGGGTMTVTANTAAITLTGAAANFSTSIGAWGGTVSFTGSGAAQILSTGGSIGNLTRTGTAAKTDSLLFSSNVTVTGTLTLNGNSATNRILVQSSTISTTRTITAATVSVSNADFMDITGAGAGSWNLAAITGLSGDAGGNSGITFTTGATQYRVGATSVASLWTDTTKWASTTGGSGGTGRIPLPQDDVIIDNNSTVLNVNVVIDMPRAGRTIDSTGYTLAGSFAPMVATTNGGVATTVYGSWLQTKAFNASPNTGVTFAGRGAYSLQFQNTMNAVTITAPGGTYTMLTNVTSNAALSLNNGTFDASGFTVTIATFASTPTTTRVLNMGGGAWNITSTSSTTVWSVIFTGLTVNNGGSAIVISTASANTRTFAGSTHTYGALTYTAAGSTGTLVLTGGSTFSAINFSDATNARTLQFTAATTTTISTAAGWNVNGTAGKLMSVQSVTAATHTISVASGTVSADYLSLTNSIATGGATFYAGANSTNVSGNTGWIFTAPPSASTVRQLAALGVG